MLVLAWVLMCAAVLLSAQNTPIFDIQRPTIVAFFPPVTQSELSRDTGTNEALADFQLYATQARRPLEEAGVDFKVAYARSFRVRLGETIKTFRPAKGGCGYYFVAPGAKPRVEYGVMTDPDLLQAANKYFGAARSAR